MKTKNLLNVAAIAIAVAGACSESDIISEEGEIKAPKKPTGYVAPLFAGSVKVQTKSGLSCVRVNVSSSECHDAPTGVVCTMVYGESSIEPVYTISGSVCGKMLRRIQ